MNVFYGFNVTVLSEGFFDQGLEGTGLMVSRFPHSPNSSVSAQISSIMEPMVSNAGYSGEILGRCGGDQ